MWQKWWLKRIVCTAWQQNVSVYCQVTAEAAAQSSFGKQHFITLCNIRVKSCTVVFKHASLLLQTVDKLTYRYLTVKCSCSVPQSRSPAFQKGRRVLHHELRGWWDNTHTPLHSVHVHSFLRLTAPFACCRWHGEPGWAGREDQAHQPGVGASAHFRG